MSSSPAPDSPSRLQARIEGLWVYPVKSCAGVSLTEAELTPAGLAWDRAWMVVDDEGEFVSQRELPRMALIQPSFRLGQLVLRAPGMLALHLSLEAAEWPVKVRVWDDVVQAWDMGDVAAQWFSDFLGADAPAGLRRLRLVRFDPEVRRLSSRRWTADREAQVQFADGFGVLVTSSASLEALNRRLQSAGQPAVDQRRFRPTRTGSASGGSRPVAGRPCWTTSSPVPAVRSRMSIPMRRSRPHPWATRCGRTGRIPAWTGR